ncbi:MAG: acetamidase/formamidase family protein [Actinobacteria bacterium]|nr:acetamidase/formamidase family protein [Actinomycetota bacterium]
MSLSRVPRSQHQFTFAADAEPWLRIEPGSSIVVETLDCFSNKVSSPEQRFGYDSEVLDLIGQYNPVSKPTYVSGAEPGDTLAVRIDAIDLGPVDPYAVMVVTRDTALLCGRPSRHLGHDGDTKICELRDGHVLFPVGTGIVRHPVRPMVGAIGTAPPDGAISSLHYAASCGGNMDCLDITVGATVLLPVNVPGGLLSLGDVHALMGDGEVAGVALETHGDVTVSVQLIKAGRPASTCMPRLDTPTTVGTLGCESHESIDANIAAALDDMLTRLPAEFGMTAIEAYELIGAAGRIRVNQCVHFHGQGWCTTHVAVPRAVLPGGAYWVRGSAGSPDAFEQIRAGGLGAGC